MLPQANRWRGARAKVKEIEMIEVEPVEGAWKVTDLEILQEERH